MKPPLFWLRPPHRPGLRARILTPLSWIWRGAGRRRIAQGASLRVDVPVICVGNINMGGTGKTPTVIAIVSALQNMGKIVHVVSRGYKGIAQGPRLVVEAKDTAADVGDEPLLLAAFCPTWVSKERALGVQAAAGGGADVIVMDDGHQNASVAKDLSVIVVDAQIGFGNGRVVPAGPLRETVVDGLFRADAVVMIGGKGDGDRVKADWPAMDTKPLLRGQLQPLQTGMDWQGLRVFAFAGIGRPQKFYDTLTALGADVVGHKSFDDHQAYSPSVLQRLQAEAEKLSAQLVTTEKDAARLPFDVRGQVLALPVRLDINPKDGLEKLLAGLFDAPVE